MINFLMKLVLVLVALLIIPFIAFLTGIFVMWLWNMLMPDIFNLPKISYLQAVGLVILFHILFPTNSSSSKD